MFRWLRTGNPYQVLLLLVYAIVIKYYFLIHPLAPVLHPDSDGLLYPGLIHILSKDVLLSATGFGILVFVLLFIQALLINTILNHFRIMPGNSYFPAFCFLLFSSFFRDWNTFSPALVANLLLLGFLAQLFQLYATPNVRSKAFSLGFLAGLASLIYLPLLGLVVVIWVTLLVSRPFRLAEWILAVTGVVCPYYFLGTGLFLTGRLSLMEGMRMPTFGYPHLTTAYWLLAGMILLIWWFLFGAIRLQQDYMKMMIHTRKCWQILLTFICLGLVLPFFPGVFSFSGWLVAFLPMTAFLSLGFWHIRKNWLALVVHLSALAYIFLFQWVY